MSVSAQAIGQRLELARRAACEAGRGTLAHFRTGTDVQRKADNSPVTIADRQAEQQLRQLIHAAFPDDAIVGEEFPTQPGPSGFRWVLDPIDGTKSFISGVPLYGTIVGMDYRGESLLGVIYLPALDEGVLAARGHGAWQFRGGGAAVPARVSTTARLADGLLVTSEIGGFADRGAAEAWERLERSAWITRTWGDCYGYYLVATGRAVAMIDPQMNVWDAAGILPILEEAGGTFTDWQGRPTVEGGEGIGTNGHVQEELLAITRQFPRPAASRA